MRIPQYSGYKKNTESDTSIEFATGAFRYGHSTTAPYKLLSSNFCPYTFTVPAGVFGPFLFSADELPFAGQLGGPFTPSFAYSLAGGSERIVRGLIYTAADRVDLTINNVLRNIIAVGLIGNGVDLLVSDLVRGQETDLPSYYELRKMFYKGSRQKNVYDAAGCVKGNDIDPLACFLEINADRTVAQNLQNIYKKATSIDAVIGLLAEDKENSSDYLPRTAARIILDEYLRSRDGDRFWYEQPGYLNAEELQLIEGRTFSTIVQENFPNIVLPENIFSLPNPLPSCVP